MKIKRIGKPVIPKSETDPAGAKKSVSASYRKLNQKLKRIQRGVLKLIDGIPRKAVTINALKNSERRYVYEVDANELQNISFFIQQLIYEELLGNPNGTLANRWWMNAYIENQYKRGTGQALRSTQNMATVSAVGPEASQAARAIQLEGILLSPGYQNRIGLLKARTFNDMLGLSDDMKKDLAGVLSRGMAAGEGIQKIKSDIVKRVGVNQSRAERIARTEINNAARESYSAEVDELNETVWKDTGLVTRLLWYSALSPTTRPTHAEKHGRVYNTQQVRDFYSRDANSINCLCTQVEVLVDKQSGEIINQELVDEVAAERPRYEKEAEKGKKEKA